jgi:signal transduction histidine kinase
MLNSPPTSLLKAENGNTRPAFGLIELGNLEVTEETTLGLLPTSDYQVRSDTSANLVDRDFRKNPELPGVIIHNEHGVVGAISRRKFYELLGKRYGVAVFLKRPIRYMLRSVHAQIPVLPASNRIAESVRLALNRAPDQIYEPLLVQFDRQQYRLLDSYTLLLAQSRLFATLQEKLQTVNSELEQRVAARTSELLDANTNLKQEILERHRAEDKLQTRLRYEEALTQCANALLAGGDTEGVTHKTLDYLIKSVGVSHVFMGEILDVEHAGPAIKLLHRVHVPGVSAIPDHMSIFLLQSLGAWVDELWSGQWVIGHRDEVGSHERVLMQELDFASVLLLPVGKPDDWIGVIGFGERDTKRQWDRYEIQLLQTVAQMIYAYRQRKQNALMLTRARDEALMANRFKDEILAKVSHELRTPLSAILGYAQMLSYGSFGVLKEEQKEATEMVISSSQYLSTLVNGILDQAQLNSGQLSLQNVPYHLRKLIGEVEKRMRVLAKAKGLDFYVEVESDTPQEQIGDGTRLQQVLINLLGNAIKFTEAGEINLQVEVTRQNFLRFEISDTGPGIPPEMQARIFEPFTQVDGSATRRFSGTGLGLSISQQLVHQMDGNIILESEVGKGSTFIVEIPIKNISSFNSPKPKQRERV